MSRKLISPSLFEKLLQDTGDMAVIVSVTVLWKELHTNTIAEILLLSILLSCPQLAGAPMLR